MEAVSETVTVVFGGPSPEHDISILTGLQCERVLARTDTGVQGLYWDKSGRWHLVPSSTEARDYLDGAPAKSAELELSLGEAPGWSRKKGLRSAPVEIGTILSCLHGGVGESGGASALFALLGIPATGSLPGAAALGMDKLAFGAVLEQAGVPSLPRVLLSETNPPPYAGPYIIKPRFGGSSIGIEVVDSLEAALALQGSSIHLRAGAVVEPYRTDLYDLNLSFRTYPHFQTSSLEKPTRSVSPTGIYSYADKYLHTDGLSSAPRELPAKVSDALSATTRTLAKRVAELTDLTGIVRIDFLTDGVEVFVNEVNSIPGTMSLYLWLDVPPERLLLDAVAEARADRRGVVPPVANPGAALRAAGGISGKLMGFGS